MFDLSAGAIVAIIVVGALLAYRKYQDAFHPAVVLAPLMLLGYGVWPLLLNRERALELLLGEAVLVDVGVYYLVGIACLYLGLLIPVTRRLWNQRAQNPWKVLVGSIAGERARSRVMYLSVVLACIANLVYWLGIINVGGLDEAYSSYKGGGSLSGGGWVTEMINLSFPAAILFAISRRGSRITPTLVLVLLLMLLPSLLQGTLGVRRGPFFLSLCTFYVAIIVARGKPPRLVATTLVLSLIVFLVTVIWTQRRMWFEEGEVTFDSNLFVSSIVGESELLMSNDYVAGVVSAVTTRYFDSFFWGKRWFVDVFVRPIPRQIWPNKYEDVGAYWKLEVGNPAGHTELHQVQVVGFALPQGHSIGFLSDIYSEFAWGGVVVAFLFGAFLRFVWLRHRLRGQLWSVYMLLGYALSVYLPTQSFSAWYHRFLLMAFLTTLSWRWLVGKHVKVRRNRDRVRSGHGVVAASPIGEHRH